MTGRSRTATCRPTWSCPPCRCDPTATRSSSAPRRHGRSRRWSPTPRPPASRLQLNGGYRSYEHQQELYDLYVDTYGPDAAADLVAEPGTSEHQTGLAADVGLVDLPADATFGETPASAWVAANAHRFGFVVRYPPAKADITGYRNEPWHLRHLGVGLATELFTSGRTMEEHFGLVPTTAG